MKTVRRISLSFVLAAALIAAASFIPVMADDGTPPPPIPFLFA